MITAYAIVFGGFLLLGGRLADLFGRRRLFSWASRLHRRVAALGLRLVVGLADCLPRACKALVARSLHRRACPS